MMQTLKDTGQFSDEELSDIQKYLEKNLKLNSSFDLNEFFNNLKTTLGNEIFEKLSALDVVENLQDAVKTFFNTHTIDDSDSTSIDNVLKDISEQDSSKESSKLNLTSIFEKLLSDIFSEDPTLNSNQRTISANILSLGTNDISQNSELLASTSVSQDSMQNSNYENSSMMNLSKNFDDTQNIMKIMSGNNETNNILSSKDAIKTLDSAMSTRVMERVEEALKAVAKSKDGSTISLRLDPPSLGEVKIDVTMKEGVLFARLQSSSEDVENLLKSKSLELQQILRDAGLDVDTINVYIASKDSEDNSNQSGSANSGNEKDKGNDTFNNDLEKVSNLSKDDDTQAETTSSKWIA